MELARPCFQLPAPLLTPPPAVTRHEGPRTPEQTVVVEQMLHEPPLRQLLQMAEHELPELAAIRHRLENITPEEAKLVVTEWRKMGCRNASFVEFSDVLTAALQPGST